jgi:hypothetical protein
MHYDRNGQPMELEAWGRALEDIDARRIGETFLPDGIRISTVWIGLDHNFAGVGPPLIFESMAFGSDGNGDLDCRRYATEEEARAGHSAMVAKWMAAQDSRNS